VRKQKRRQERKRKERFSASVLMRSPLSDILPLLAPFGLRNFPVPRSCLGASKALVVFQGVHECRNGAQALHHIEEELCRYQGDTVQNPAVAWLEV